MPGVLHVIPMPEFLRLRSLAIAAVQKQHRRLVRGFWSASVRRHRCGAFYANVQYAPMSGKTRRWKVYRLDDPKSVVVSLMVTEV